MVDEALEEMRRLKTIREESHHYLRSLHGRLGDSLAESEQAGADIDAKVADGPESTPTA